MNTAYLAAYAAVLAAQASPGPNMMAVAGSALKQGRRAALFTVSGVVTGTLVWSVATGLGLGEVFRRFPQLMTVLMFVGGLYLLWIGGRSLVIAWQGRATSFRPNAEDLSARAAWRRGLLVVMTNPKAALMWSAIATFLLGSGLPLAGVLAFGPFVALSAAVIYGGYGLLFSSHFALRVYQRFMRGIELAFGAAFGALGAALLLAGVRALRG